MSEAFEYEEIPFTGYTGKPIKNDLEADEAIQAIHEAEAHVERMAEWYKKALEQIKEQQDAVIQNELARLEEYFASVPHHKTDKQESYKLPSGKLIRKAQQPEWQKKEKVVIDWLKSSGNTQYIKVNESLCWEEMKKSVIAKDGKAVDPITQEIIPGIDVIERDPVFTIGK